MSNIDTVISKVRRDLNKYDDAGLIDENELYSDAITCLKRFGNDIGLKKETFIQVTDGFATLPEDFMMLHLALLCEPDYYQTSGIEFHTLQSSLFYKERVEIGGQWGECDTCPKPTEDKVIRENIYFNPGGLMTFYYKKPILLNLVKGFAKEACAPSCFNRMRSDNPYEINIVSRRTLHANFRNGTIMLRYIGMPTDEDGNIDIPDTFNGHMYTYMEYYLKRRLAEQLIANGDAQGIQNLYQAYKAEETVALRNTVNDLKMGRLNYKDFRKRMMKLNRLETLQYEISTPVLWR